jgi:hypothetical protein
MNKLVYTMLGSAFIVFLFFTIMANAGHSASSGSSVYKGTLVSVEGDQRKVTVAGEEGEKTFTLAKSVWVFKDERKSDLRDLAPGDEVELIFNTTGQAAYIKAYSEKEQAIRKGQKAASTAAAEERSQLLEASEQPDQHEEGGSPFEKVQEQGADGIEDEDEVGDEGVSGEEFAGDESPAGAAGLLDESIDIGAGIGLFGEDDIRGYSNRKGGSKKQWTEMEIEINGEGLKIEIKQERKRRRIQTEANFETEDGQWKLRGKRAERFVAQLLSVVPRDALNDPAKLGEHLLKGLDLDTNRIDIKVEIEEDGKEYKYESRRKEE